MTAKTFADRPVASHRTPPSLPSAGFFISGQPRAAFLFLELLAAYYNEKNGAYWHVAAQGKKRVWARLCSTRASQLGRWQAR